ncbi:hypothetical protein [Methylobacter sp.]|uniref:hypothetical protein n=1 Tax=Methylobacter sp. TaxID=2051955 RepID=UPI003DA2ECDE
MVTKNTGIDRSYYNTPLSSIPGIGQGSKAKSGGSIEDSIPTLKSEGRRWDHFKYFQESKFATDLIPAAAMR